MRDSIPVPAIWRRDQERADASLAHARTVRRQYRRRTKRHYPERIEAIQEAIEWLERRGHNLRRHKKRADHNRDIGPYDRAGRYYLTLRLRELRLERAKLRRMLPRI